VCQNTTALSGMGNFFTGPTKYGDKLTEKKKTPSEGNSGLSVVSIGKYLSTSSVDKQYPTYLRCTLNTKGGKGNGKNRKEELEGKFLRPCKILVGNLNHVAMGRSEGGGEVEE